MTTKLSKTQVKEISGDKDDLNRSLDGERDWVTVTCKECRQEHVIQVPNPEDNLESVTEDVEATLPDGSKLVVPVTHGVPSNVLRWECHNHDVPAVQTTSLERVK